MTDGSLIQFTQKKYSQKVFISLSIETNLKQRILNSIF